MQLSVLSDFSLLNQELQNILIGLSLLEKNSDSSFLKFPVKDRTAFSRISENEDKPDCHTFSQLYFIWEQ